MRAASALLPLLLLLPAPGRTTEVRFRTPADACPVEPAERWGWRVEVYSEAPGQWLVRTQASGQALPDPEALRPLAEAVRAVKARMAYASDAWTEDPDQALRAGRGNCISFTAVLERDLKDLGYRSRRVHGLLFSPDASVSPYYLAPLHATPHRWLEVFTADFGWVPLDPVAPQGRLTGRHVALRGDDTAGWVRGMTVEVLRWD